MRNDFAKALSVVEKALKSQNLEVYSVTGANYCVATGEDAASIITKPGRYCLVQVCVAVPSA